MATFLLKDATGKVVLDLTSNLTMYVETIDVTLPKGSAMTTIVRRLDTAANRERWWAYVASGEVLSSNGLRVESYSNGLSCAVGLKSMFKEAGLPQGLLDQMDDISTYLIIFDCRSYYNTSFQQTVQIHLGRC
ncbi:hypothetical protein Aci011_032 [Acinetobacter phage vB_AbaM_B09_Aci01-1]|uniref:Uncharacterized protein n=3 Tax=Saclayvirus TaxID=2733128 RepID=A0A386KL23_9CAUD|nr:hypothetical protein HOU29_gp149 [Acinetobacter phage vB_AbaM_B09_Aci01-1]YP_009813255.1 hypothetical protein HOU30_gp157 [Acinetobacter phage vB_AbaM_B09_Aci02-2]YP_009813885.1 hypothetical protein HOU35_gp146 [Acinetobacter phage vB_AbaM_B09_Aci05]AYD82389.1 hypothetical protein Aci05_031 [Acinetobacter phage vB_AbaM_B09_Aci05]AYD85604.1 hypothetical protein Aci011_032 [Acinetobacter phage vB_AbaM_B09_Aci01-1]AYD85764.1 hypothetical protein Aci022_033 [Acinetobacter phage vB_AbaM_B09_Aci0